MSTVLENPVMLDSTGQEIVEQLEEIAGLMGGPSIIDDTSTAADKTWSASKLNTDISAIEGKIPSTASSSNKMATADDVASRVPWSANAVLGVHNMLPITLAEVKSLNTSGTWSGNVFTFHNVAFTFTETNGYVTKISATGQADADTYVHLKVVPHGTYINDIVSGCPSGGSGQSYAVIASNMVDVTLWDYGEGVKVTNDTQTQYRISLFVHNGYNASAVEFTPMVRLASDPDTTPAPYAMTNQQLTPTRTSVDNKIEVEKQCGVVTLQFIGNLVLDEDGKSMTTLIPVGYRPKTNVLVSSKVYNGSTYVDCVVKLLTDGTIQVTDFFSGAIEGLQPTFIQTKAYTYLI